MMTGSATIATNKIFITSYFFNGLIGSPAWGASVTCQVAVAVVISIT